MENPRRGPSRIFSGLLVAGLMAGASALACSSVALSSDPEPGDAGAGTPAWSLAARAGVLPAAHGAPRARVRRPHVDHGRPGQRRRRAKRRLVFRRRGRLDDGDGGGRLVAAGAHGGRRVPEQDVDDRRRHVVGGLDVDRRGDVDLGDAGGPFRRATDSACSCTKDKVDRRRLRRWGDEISDVWSSTDGAGWTEVTLAAAWLPRNGFGCVVFEGKMWSSTGFARVTSGRRPTAASWTAVTPTAPFIPALYVADRDLARRDLDARGGGRLREGRQRRLPQPRRRRSGRRCPSCRGARAGFIAADRLQGQDLAHRRRVRDGDVWKME